MDPNTTLQLIQSYIDDRDFIEAQHSCNDLYRWLHAEGFEPTWEDFPVAAIYFRNSTPAI